MTRVKAIYRSWGIPCAGKQVYAPRHRAEWLGEDQRTGSAPAGGVLLPTTRCAASLAPGSAAGSAGGEQETQGLETALPDSFDRSDSGGRVAGHRADTASFPHQAAAVEVQRFCHRDAQQRRSPVGQRAAQRTKKQISVRGLNRNCNHDLKNLFKGAAIVASSKPGPFQEFYAALVAKGMRPEMARLTLARKIATIVLIVWKRGVCFDAQYLKPQTA